MLSVVVPTYKEAGNLENLAERLAAALQLAGLDFELIIADDNSPDETAEVCRRLAGQYPLRLICAGDRPRDLSASVIDGIRAARFDHVLVMDADLSHPPETVPRMVSALEQHPASFIVGSRYTEGGEFDRAWSLWRFLNSQVATVLARPLVKCSDPMSGFFLFDKTRVDVDRLHPLGYKIGLEIMVRGDFEEVLEVPIAFTDREVGSSKMNLSQQLRYLRHLRRLYLYRFGGPAEFLHFGMVGASGFIIDVTFYYLFQFFGAPHELARALSFWPAVSWNWAVNRRGTFGERRRRPRGRQWAEFVVASGIGFLINWGCYYLLTAFVPFFDQYRILALVTGILAASVINFTLSTTLVYSDTRK